MVRPLTKRKKDGKLYVRPGAVEEQIEEALGEDAEALRRRLRIHDRASSGYLKTECLVHVVREGSRTGNDRLMNAALQAILVRCRSMLKTIVSGSLPDAEEIREKVLHQVSLVLARGVANTAANSLDIYECNFYWAFRALNWSVLRIELNKEEREAEFVDGDEIDGYGTDVLKSVTETLQDPEALASRDELLDQMEQALTKDEFNAVVLCRVLKVKEESKDPEEMTAARLFDCAGRTIRYRLKRAEAKLSRFEEGQ